MLAALLALAAIPRVNAESIDIRTYESGTMLTAVITARDLMTPVIGTAFDLYYDPEVLSYLGYEHGAFFEQGGEPIYLVVPDADHKGGKIVTGISLKRTDTLINSSGTIIALNFEVLNKNSTDLTFKNQIISTIEDGKRKDLEIEWINKEIYLTEEIPVVAKELPQPEPVAEEPEIAELTQANILKPEFPLAMLIPLLILPLICYILVRKLRKRRANKALKTFNPRFGKPTPLYPS